VKIKESLKRFIYAFLIGLDVHIKDHQERMSVGIYGTLHLAERKRNLTRSLAKVYFPYRVGDTLHGEYSLHFVPLSNERKPMIP
jgi:hypothetical protein